jgi:hypothetical protein
MPEQSTPIADDPFRSRRPISHERMSGRSWDASYTDDGPAPWDLGRPQPAIARLASRGVFAGSMLDAGCGTGEHTLLVASLGLPVLGGRLLAAFPHGRSVLVVHRTDNNVR